MGHRTAVIGDVGGHTDVFEAALRSAGVDVTRRRIPAGLSIIQVGDLVHKGPDSAGCVALADQLLRDNGDRYVQLVGNHEAHYLGGPDLSSRAGVVPVDDTAQGTLRRWWRERSAHLAVAISRADGTQLLVTHGGLTHGLWRELGEPSTAQDAADRVNALRHDPARAFRPGWLMTGRVDHAAGVTNPRTGAELAVSWLAGDPMPFDQAHGHEGVWSWPRQDWHVDVPPAVQARAWVDHRRRLSTVRVPGGSLTSVDWVLDAVAPARDWDPYVVDGTVAR